MDKLTINVTPEIKALLSDAARLTGKTIEQVIAAVVTPNRLVHGLEQAEAGEAEFMQAVEEMHRLDERLKIADMLKFLREQSETGGLADFWERHPVEVCNALKLAEMTLRGFSSDNPPPPEVQP